jgi:hypothetical protein
LQFKENGVWEITVEPSGFTIIFRAATGPRSFFMIFFTEVEEREGD